MRILTISISALAAGAISLICLSGPPSSAQCIVLAVYQPEEIRNHKSLAIRVLPIENQNAGTRYQYRAEPLEDLRLLLAQKLEKNLQASRAFNSIVLSGGNSVPTDLVLEARLTEVIQGSRVIPVPITPLGGPTKLNISGELRTANSRQPVLKFVCQNETYGGLFVNRPKKWMHRNIDHVGKDLTAKLIKIVSEPYEASPATSQSIIASSETASASHVYLYSLIYPPDKWRARGDAMKKIFAGIQKQIGMPAMPPLSSSNPSAAGTVAALWVTPRNPEDFRFIYPLTRLLPTPAAPPEGMGSEEIILTERDKIYRDLKDGEIIVLRVWFAKRGTTIWEVEKMRNVTTLRNLKYPNEYVHPLRTLELAPYPVFDPDWVYNSVIFVFPSKRSDGSAIVESVNDGMELRTEMDRREVIIRTHD